VLAIGLAAPMSVWAQDSQPQEIQDDVVVTARKPLDTQQARRFVARISKTVIQLADYATMRALARTRPVEDVEGIGTILTLFDSATPPQSVTDADVAYLTALYAMPGTRSLNYQVGRIAKGVKGASAPKP